jgi:hypothetical protein
LEPATPLHPNRDLTFSHKRSGLATLRNQERIQVVSQGLDRDVPEPAPYLVVVAPRRCRPSARITFITVANSGLPSGESAL